MDYYVATKLEIYRKCLVIGKYTDQKKKRLLYSYTVSYQIFKMQRKETY